MVYQVHEGCLALTGTWKDQSVNILVPEQVATKGVNLVIARDIMPLGMTLPAYVSQQKANFAKEMTDFRLAADAPGAVDQRPAHFLEFVWNNNGKPIQQVMVVIQDHDRILSLSGTIPGPGDETARSFLVAAMVSFKFSTAVAVAG